MNVNMKNLAVWALIIIMFLVMLQVSSTSMKAANAPTELTYSEMVEKAESGGIAEAQIDSDGGKITGVTTDDKKFTVNAPRFESEKTQELFETNNIAYDYDEVKQTSTLAAVLINILPLLLIVGISILIFRSMQGGGRGGAMSFGKSRAKMLTENTKRVTFADVAGVESAKEDLKEVVEFLEDPSRFTRLGAKIPTGALLIGPPGTGKHSLLAPLQARRVYRSLQFRALTLLKCLLASVRLVSAICLLMRVRMRLVSSLSTRLMLWGVTAVLGHRVVMKNASKP